jgi:dTDP-4-amino-4,6-dideoxygalactose transaminase
MSSDLAGLADLADSLPALGARRRARPGAGGSPTNRSAATPPPETSAATSTEELAVGPVAGVPGGDLAWEEALVEREVDAGFAQVMLGDVFVRQPLVAACEQALALYCGVQSAVGVASGVDAVELGLRAGGVGPGDECLLPANAPPAIVEAVLRCGAVPVFVDIVADTQLIDADAAIAAAHSATAAVIPVHRHGRAVDVSRLRATADRCAALLLEDATEAAGARIGGRMAGALGDIAVTSFPPGSNLAARTDGGAVTTDTPELAEHVRLLRTQGEPDRFAREMVALGSRLDALQAVIVAAKLRRLDGWNVLRRAAAGRYGQLLAGVADVAAPPLPPLGQGEQHVWRRYVIRVPASRRDAVAAALVATGIEAEVPSAAMSMPGRCPRADRVAAEAVGLPLFPAIRPDQQERVVETLRALL